MISDPDVVGLLYLVTIVCFIVALSSSRRRSTRGRGTGSAARGCSSRSRRRSLLEGIGNWALIVVGRAIGTVVGVVGARTVRMTAMPQMVAIFNGVGGGAAALVALAEWHKRVGVRPATRRSRSCSRRSSARSRSPARVVAFAKLQELVSGRPIVFPGQNVVNILVLLAAVALGVAVDRGRRGRMGARRRSIGLALLFGVMFVLPIGGADMPVVISLLNAFTGLAASATGFVLDSTVLIVVGDARRRRGHAADAAHGEGDEPLDRERPLRRVRPGADRRGHGARRRRPDGARDDARTTSPCSSPSRARSIVVPGYGMAVAQAQHDVRQLADLLEERGVDVKYAIHPVAGRMPGHMNVLLAEANVPYTQLQEMDEINPEFPQTDVALVIGANDVTNPAARSDPASPIYGMPILDVDKAASIVVLKRSMNPGFAGIDNELYLDPKTTMLFGDAKESVLKLIAAVKAVARQGVRRRSVAAPSTSASSVTPTTTATSSQNRPPSRSTRSRRGRARRRRRSAGAARRSTAATPPSGRAGRAGRRGGSAAGRTPA